MSTRVRALSALPLVILSLSACQAAPPAGLSDADKTALRQNDEVFATSANARVCRRQMLNFVAEPP